MEKDDCFLKIYQVWVKDTDKQPGVGVGRGVLDELRRDLILCLFDSGMNFPEAGNFGFWVQL